MTKRVPFAIGDAGHRAIIALYLTPESADDLAGALAASDLGGVELREAAALAREWLDGSDDLDSEAAPFPRGGI